MGWEAIIQNDRFKSATPLIQREKADMYFEDKIEPTNEYQALGKGGRQQTRVNFLSSIGQEPDEIGGFFAPLQRGYSRASSAATVGMLELMANYAPDDFPLFGSEDLLEAADFWRQRSAAYMPETKVTGGFTQPIDWSAIATPSDPRSPLSPKRLWNISEGIPLLGGFIAASAVNPVLGTAMMAAIEGGSSAEGLRKYEEETGVIVPEWQKKTIPLAVGIINAYLEKAMLPTLMGKGAGKAVKSKLARLLIAGSTEGLEETVQAGVTMLGEAGYGKPHENKQVMTELLENFYGGFVLGGAARGAFMVVDSPVVKAKAPEITQLEKPVPGLNEVTPTMRSMMGELKIIDKEIAENPDDVELFATRERVESFLVQTWDKHNENDIGGVALSKVMEDAGLITTKQEPIRISDEDYAKKTLNIKVGDRTITVHKATTTVKRDDMDRVLTAIDWIQREAPRFLKRLDRVVVASGTQGAWLTAVSKVVSGVGTKRFKNISPEKYAEFIEKHKDSAGIYFVDKNGKMTAMLRGENPKAPEKTTKRYVRGIIHEAVHAETDVEAGKTEELREMQEAIEESTADTTGGIAAERFAKDFPHLDFQRTTKYDVRIKHWEDRRDAGIILSAKGDRSGTALIQRAEKEIERLQLKAEEVLFQKVPFRSQSEQRGPSEAERYNLIHGMGQLFRTIQQSQGQLTDAKGFPVTAAVDDFGNLFLSKDIKWDTVGHEAFHMAVKQLGFNNSIVKAGLELAGGDVEVLGDLVGAYYADINLPIAVYDSTYKKISAWLRDLWAEFKLRVGAEVAQQDVIRMLTLEAQKLGRSEISSRTPTQGAIEYQGVWRDLREINILTGKTDSEIKVKPDVEPEPEPKVKPDKRAEKRAASKKAFETHLSLQNYQWQQLYNKYKEKIVPTLEEQGTVGFAETQSASTKFLENKNVDTNALELLQMMDRGEGLTNQQSINLSAYASRMVTMSMKDAFMKDPKAAVQQLVNDSIGQTWAKVYADLSSEAGRSLALRKSMSPDVVLFQLIKQLEADDSLTPYMAKKIKQAADAKEFTDPKAIKELIDNLEEPGIKDMVLSIMYNGLLSAFTTWGLGVNLFTNATWLSYLLTARPAYKSMVQSARSSKLMKALAPMLSIEEQTVFFGDIANGWKGALRGPTGRGGIIKAARLVKRITFGEQDVPADLRTKWRRELGVAHGAFHRSRFFGKSEIFYRRAIAHTTEAPTNMLIIQDVFFRAVAADASMNIQITNEAERTGIDMKAVPVTKKMKAIASDFGLHATFFDKPGRLANGIRTLRNIVPYGAGRPVIPFIDTITNILIRGIELTPVLGLTQLAVSKDADSVIAAQLEGATFLLVMMLLFGDDEEGEERLTGAPPRDAAERTLWMATGKIPYGFLVGDTWISYERGGEPFSVVLSLVTALRDSWREDEEDRSEGKRIERAEQFLNASAAVMKELTSQIAFSGMMRIMGTERGFEGWAKRLPSMFVPMSGLMREVNRTIEFIQTGSIKDKEKNTAFAYMNDVLPWFITEPLPAKINGLGEEITIQGGVLSQWLPFKWQEALSEDSVEVELERLGIYPRLPDKELKIGLKTVELPDDFWRAYCISYGAATKRAFTSIMTQQSYLRATDAQRIRYLNARSAAFRAQARARAKVEARSLGLDKL